jgi:hypothetical protein
MYDYTSITKLGRQQTEAMHNHENVNVRGDKANRDTGNIRGLNLAAVDR